MRAQATCQTPARPYLHPENPRCVALMDVPQISDVTLRPPAGGKAPVNVEFCADVSFQFPELASGTTLSWDIDGNSGKDVDVPVNQCANFTYDDCESGTIEIFVTPQDRFGRTGQTITRSIQIVCNELPVVSCVVTKTPTGPPNGSPGDSMRFFITGFDPDHTDPDLDDSNGITRFEIDFEGDGSIDLERPANLQLLPLDRAYHLAGAFRPIVRGYDPDGDFGDTSCGLVTIFPETRDSGGFWLSGSGGTNAVWPGNQAGRPVTSVFTGSHRFGVGFVSQREPGRALLMHTHRQTSGDDPLGFAGLENALFSRNGNGIRLLHLGPDDNGAPETISRLNCPGLSAHQIAIASFASGSGPHDRLVRRQDTQLMVSDVTGLGSGFDPGDGETCHDYLASVTAGELIMNAEPFGDNFSIADFAAAVSAVFAAVDGMGTGGDDFGVAHFDLATTSETPVCAVTSDGCVRHNLPVSRVAARAREAYRQTLYGAFATAATYESYALDRFVDMEADDGRLWVDDVPYAASATTWWYRSDTAIAVSETISGALSFSATALGLLAFSDTADAVSVLSYAGHGTSMCFTGRATAVSPVPIEQLLISDGHLAIRSSAAAPVGARGIYLSPVTDLHVVARVETYRESLRQAGNYGGARQLAAQPGWGFWVADGPQGLYGIPTQPLDASRYIGITDVIPGLVPRALDVGIGGAINSVRIPDASRRAALAPAYGVGIIDFAVNTALPAASIITPSLRVLRLGGDAVAGIDILSGATSQQNIFALAVSNRVDLIRENQFDQELATYTPPAGSTVLHVRLVRDPDPLNHAILYTFERNASGKTEVFLQGFDAAGVFVPARSFRVPNEFVGSDSSVAFGNRPPVFARLNANQDRARTMDGVSGGTTRICIEPFWGEMCPQNDDGDPIHLFTTLVGGRPYLTFLQEISLIVRENVNSGILDITDVDGIALRRQFSPCFELPEAEQFPCTQEKTITTAAPADPFWLHANGYAMIYTRLNDPLQPRIVSRSTVGNNTVNGMAGWLDGLDLLVAWYCSGADSHCDGNRRLRTLRVPGVAPN